MFLTSTVSSFNLQAISIKNLKRYHEALPYYEKALKIIRLRLGASHVKAMKIERNIRRLLDLANGVAGKNEIADAESRRASVFE